jgi:FixJ family two-component response regulator
VATHEIKSLNGAFFVLSRTVSGHELLTVRERTFLAQIVRGASSKEAARSLISVRVPSNSIELFFAEAQRQEYGRSNADHGW